MAAALTRLARRPHFLLAAHLLMLHVLAFGGWQNLAVRLLWLVALGLFLIWQPFVEGERPVSLRQGLTLSVFAVVSTFAMGPWLLLVWCGALAAVIGGRVLWTERRLERAGYLLAFGYLVCVTVFGAMPEVSPAVVLDPLPREGLARWMPILLLFLLVFPAGQQQRRAGDAFDLFYGVMVFLVLAVFVLGALAYMLIGGVTYVESLFQTSMGLAGALLVVAWAWNPRAGFAGVGWAVSRYLLSVGMPLEQWLVQLSEDNEREADPERFLASVMLRLHGMSWVVGVRWQTPVASKQLSEQDRFPHHYQVEGLSLSVFSRYPSSPAMAWHVGWLLRLAAEFYLVKRHTYELRRMSYLQAVYETGARVTHDVKNLLQSMQVLCYAAEQPGDPEQLAALLGRQLPQIVERLKITLEKLQSPQTENAEWINAGDWWLAMRERYSHAGIIWQGSVEQALLPKVPKGLFDSVAENLLQNALSKRLQQAELVIEVKFLERGFRVADNGTAVRPEIADVLLRDPVASEDGLGIGLFHAARQAAAMNFRLTLVDNYDGCVAFELSAVS